MKNLNINWMKSVLFIGLMVLVNIEIFAQLANVRYSVRVGNIQSREFNACYEFGNEEYTAYAGFYDNNNTSLTQSGCLTCTTNGNCNYGGGTFLGTRTNNSDRLYYWLFAFENDLGSRCSYNSGAWWQNGDDCRISGSPGFVNFRNSYPSNNSYTVGPQANYGNHAIRLDWTWRYSGNANTLNPGCSAGFASYSSGAIRSWSVNMTAGRTYRFSTLGLSSEDTYIRIYSSNGYSIVASNDDANGSLQSNLNYTASSSGTYYVEVARFSRNPLNASGNLLYQDVSTPSINGGQIASSTSVCTGGNISISNIAGSSGGFGTGLSYQWQSSTNGSNWSNIGGATAATYSTSNLTSTNYYRRVSTDCKNTTGVSNVVVATVVADPQVSISTAAPDATICVGGTTGLTANVSGGTGTFNYQWQYLSNGNWLNTCSSCTNVSQNASPSATRDYRVLVSNASGCNAIGVQTVTVVADPVFTISGTDVSCNGLDNGTATATISGGTNQTYQYNWFSDDGISSNNNPTGDGSLSVSDLGPNTWVVQTTGQQWGCFASASIDISEPDALAVSASSGNILCNGGTTDITIAASGGTAAYSYMPISVFINEIHYDNAGADAGEAIEIAGTAGLDLTGWSICLYNGNGGGLYKTRNLSGSLSNPSNGFGFSTEYISGIQNGAPDGVALVNNQGLVLQFLSYEGAFTATNGPAAGLTSTNIGVSEASSTSLGFSLQLQGNGSSYSDFSWASAQSNTFGSTNNNQSFSGSGGAQTSPVFSNVTAGNYTYLVSDANGCTATTDITISEPTLLSSNSTSGSILCFGGTTTVNVTANGGTAPYTGTGSFTVGAGTYSYTVTDANGCTTNTSITVSEPTLLSSNSTSGAILCFGGTTTVNVTASGGTAPYTGTGSFTVGAGTYSYTVTDANGCTTNTSITVSEPTLLSSNSTSGAILCFGGTTTVNVTASGGTAPYTGTGSFTVGAGTYSYTVTDANGCTANTSITVSEPTLLSSNSTSGAILCFGGTTTVNVTASGGTAPYTGTGSFTVVAGTYSYTVTDANGCTANTSITVSEPTLLSSNSTSGAILCFGGTTTVNVTASGGTAPYTGTGSFTVGAGTYSYTVTDANGCTANTSITIGQPTQVVANAGSDQIVYYGYAPMACASLGATATGGTGSLSYQWFDGNGNSISNTATVNVCPSTTTTYQIVATDANGCTATDLVTVCVVDVVCYAGNSNNAKVEMCHVPPGNPGNAHTICVNANAVPAHLANGSTLGSCAEVGACIAARVFQDNDNTTAEELSEKDYIFKLFPNPTSGALNVEFSQIVNEDFQIEIIDLLGRVIHTELPLGNQTISIDISHLTSGSYLIRVIDQAGLYNTQQFVKK